MYLFKEIFYLFFLILLFYMKFNILFYFIIFISLFLKFAFFKHNIDKLLLYNVINMVITSDKKNIYLSIFKIMYKC